ncbi:MAG: PT domain-containing protein [Oscillospiraceae bacterium]|nr:PT domain-containing protein [Oscillospiraceae bacterium]
MPNNHSTQQFTGGIQCLGCGFLNPPGNTYCNGCGRPLVPDTQDLYTEKPKKKLSGAAIALICIGIAAAIGCATVALIIWGPFSFGSNSDDAEPTETATETIETEQPIEEPTDEPTERPTDRPTSRPTSEPENNYEVSTHAPSYSYYSTTDSTHSFRCDYPAEFSFITPPADHKWLTYALEAYDGTGYIYIGGAKGKSAEKTAADFINTAGNSGTVLVNDQVDGVYCRVKTKNSSGYHYAYFDLSNNQLRGFEVHYDSDQDSRYSKYISHMEDTLYCY